MACATLSQIPIEMFRVVWLVLLNEFRLLARDRVGLFMLILAPVIIIVVAGFSLGNIYGAGPSIGAYTILIVDEDHGPLASAIKLALRRDSQFVILEVKRAELAQKIIEERDRAPLAILIPANASRMLETGRDVSLVLYVDPAKRLEANNIELRLDALFRKIAANAQQESRRNLKEKGDALQKQLRQSAMQLERLRAAISSYRKQIVGERKTAELRLNAQLRSAIARTEREIHQTVAQSTAQAKVALNREMEARRGALQAVTSYLLKLQTTEREFDEWFAELKKIAGSYATDIPQPPAFPAAPMREFSELSKPPVLPDVLVPAAPEFPPLRLKLPELPKPPNIDLPSIPASPLLSGAMELSGNLSWSEHPFDSGNPRPNAFDQYVPGFGITFLLIAMLMAIAMGLIDERDWGTLHRARISGASLPGILIGKLCSRFVIGMFQMIVLFAVGWILFGVSLGPVPAMLLLPTAAIAFSATAFSILMASIARTRDSVMPIGAVAAMAMSAIGGCWWPLDFEPLWMRAVARWVPTTWTMQAYNDLMIRHTAASSAVLPSAYAAGLGCIYLIIGTIVVCALYE